MTPAVMLLQQQRIPHQTHSYEHAPGQAGYGLEAAEKLGLPPAQVFKTLLVSDGSAGLRVALVPVAGTLDMKKLAQVAGVKKLAMAEGKVAERLTGYQLGGISPLGQKRLFPTVIDSSSQAFASIFISGGRRGLEIELAPDALMSVLNAVYGDIVRY